MTFKIVPDSHLDHGLTAGQIEWLKETFAARDSFFIESVELPEALGMVPCGLHGPVMGDEPVSDAEVTLVKRGDREHPSRIVDRPTRPTRTVTVIAGPHGDETCVLFTAFGGPLAPKEPGDTEHGSDERTESEDFWSQHALSPE
jgi:hypothetical protein